MEEDNENRRSDTGVPAAFIFDFDGTVADSMGMWCALWPAFVGEEYGVSATIEDFAESESLAMLDECAFVHKKYGIGRDGEELYGKLYARLRRVYAGRIALRPGARAFLDEARAAGIPLVVATSTPRELVESCMAVHGLTDYFLDVVTTKEAGASKDHPDVYDLALARVAHAARPEEAWVFEDAMFGLAAARGAGYRTVGIYDAHGRADRAVVEANSTLFVTSFEQLRLADVLGYEGAR